jgi:protein-tyrosine kinase
LGHNNNTHQCPIITNEAPKDPVSEAFRTLRTNIQFVNVDKTIETIMVTSTAMGEGKSTISANLAIVMAQSGKNTVIVDADMRKPTVHHTFRYLNHEGLTTVLTGQAEFQKVIKTNTNIKNLDVLTSGPVPPWSPCGNGQVVPTP